MGCSLTLASPAARATRAVFLTGRFPLYIRFTTIRDGDRTSSLIRTHARMHIAQNHVTNLWRHIAVYFVIAVVILFRLGSHGFVRYNHKM